MPTQRISRGLLNVTYSDSVRQKNVKAASSILGANHPCQEGYLQNQKIPHLHEISVLSSKGD